MTGLGWLLSPKSIALVGASSDPAKFGGRPLAALRRHGFDGDVHVVNPRGGHFEGADKVVTAIEELPEGLDLAVLLTPAEGVLAALESCASRGVRSAAVFSGGFLEAGGHGADRQAALRRFCDERGLRLLGPNTPGFVNVHDRVACSASAFVAQSAILAGSAAFVSQSGGIAGVLADRAISQGIGLSAVVSTGNEVDVGVADVLEWLVLGGQTRAVGLFLEGLGSGPRVIEALAAARRDGLRIAVLRAGRSEGSQRVIASHTGALVGSQVAFDAACRDLGIAQVKDYQGLLETTNLLSREPGAGRRVVVVGFSGGMNAILADAASDHEVSLPELEEATAVALNALTPDFGAASNPADISSVILKDPDRLGRAIGIVAADPGVDTAVVVVGDHPPALSERFATVIAQAREVAPVPVVVQWSAGELSASGIREATRLGLAVFSEPGRCMEALGVAATVGAWREPTPRAVVPAPALAAGLDWSEHEVKELLDRAGLATPRRRLLGDARDARRAAEELGGVVVVKANCSGAVHKSDFAAVRVGVDVEDAPAVAASVELAAAAHLGPARVRGVLVEEMVVPVAEFLVSGSVDEHVGPLISVASGGVLVDLIADSVTRMAPVDEAGALEMVAALRGARLLQGFRAGPPGDVLALAKVVSRVSELVASWRDEVELLELNPVAVLASGAVVLDAVLTTKSKGEL